MERRQRINLPSFLIIGVQKGATSWLYYCIKEHPEIYVPSKKKEVNLLGGEKYHKKGWEWWIDRFAESRDEQVVGDVSVDYIYSQEAPKLISRHLGKIKLIVSLRNPIDRAVSAYYWNMRKGKIPNLSLNEGFKVALEKNYKNYPKAVQFIYEDIIKRGFYDEQISRYLSFFDLQQFLFLSFNKIKQNPAYEIKRVYKFLDVDSSYQPKALEYKPKQNSYLRPLISIERMGSNSRFLTKIIDWINILTCQFEIDSIPEIDFEIFKKLQLIYSKHNKMLKKILQVYQKKASPIVTQQTDWIEEIEKWKFSKFR